jgi:hypothetical protein
MILTVTAIISLNGINQLIFVMVKCCVFFAVQTKSLNIIQMSFGNKSVSKANHRLRQLYPILNKSSYLNINLALTIYKTLIRPIITYAAPAWGYAAKTHLSKVQVFQNKVLRIVTKLPRVTSIEILHDQTGMETIKSHVRKLARKLYFKSQYNENAQIRQLGQYDPIFDKHKGPRALLVDLKPELV